MGLLGKETKAGIPGGFTAIAVAARDEETSPPHRMTVWLIPAEVTQSSSALIKPNKTLNE